MKKAWIFAVSLLAGCPSEPDPRLAALERRVQSLEALEAISSERWSNEWARSDDFERRIGLVEDATPGIGYFTLGWRTQGRWIVEPRVHAHPLDDSQSEIRVQLQYRSVRCPDSVRVRVFGYDAINNFAEPTLLDERIINIATECAGRFTINRPAYALSRVDFGG